MNNFSKKVVNENGCEETYVFTSSDNKSLDLDKTYVLASRRQQGNFEKKFRRSFLGSDIGFKSSGFTSVAILATVIAVAVFVMLYFMWRF